MTTCFPFEMCFFKWQLWVPHWKIIYFCLFWAPVKSLGGPLRREHLGIDLCSKVNTFVWTAEETFFSLYLVYSFSGVSAKLHVKTVTVFVTFSLKCTCLLICMLFIIQAIPNSLNVNYFLPVWKLAVFCHIIIFSCP